MLPATRLHRVAWIIAIAVAALVLSGALFYLVVGIRSPGTAETGDPIVSYYPASHAIIPAAASGAIIASLIMSRKWIAWTALAFLTIYSVMFVFSVGTMLLPLVLVLAACLLMLSTKRSRREAPAHLG